MTDHQRLLGIAHEAVDHAVKLFNAGNDHQLTAKGDRDYATETDFRIEHELRDRLAEATPEIGFLGEETGHTGSQRAVVVPRPDRRDRELRPRQPTLWRLPRPGRRRRTHHRHHRPTTTQ